MKASKGWTGELGAGPDAAEACPEEAWHPGLERQLGFAVVSA